jgi:hypothetical protein
MTKVEEHPIAKYDDKYWVVTNISYSNDMATIWRNGQPALIPLNMLEMVEEKNKG